MKRKFWCCDNVSGEEKINFSPVFFSRLKSRKKWKKRCRRACGKDGGTMTREEAVNRLCDIYSGEFDVRLCEEHRKPLAAQMDFYADRKSVV